jgi:hypothetical protein
VVVVRPDGSQRLLLRARKVLGVHVAGDRIAWALRDCDDLAVATARIAQLPEDGVDAMAPPHCPRPVVEGTTIAVDRDGRGKVPVRCANTCRGWLTLIGVVPDEEWGTVHRNLLRHWFSLSAGRHRIAFRLGDEDRRRVARRRGRTDRMTLVLAGTIGGRAFTRRAQVRVTAR